MKNFFKKLSFVMALAMVLTALAPAVAGADASYIYKRGNDTQKEAVEVWFGDAEAKRDLNVKINGKKTTDGTWKIGNTKIATIDENGVVTPVKNGTTTAKFTDADGNVAKVKVVVGTRAAGVKVKDNGVAVTELAMTVGEAKELKFGAYISGKAKNAGATKASQEVAMTVEGEAVTTAVDGKYVTVTAAKAGEATITFTAGKKTTTLTVTVVDGLAAEQTGANKITVKGSDLTDKVADYAVKRGTVTLSVKSVTLNADKTEAVLTASSSNMPKGDYTLSFKGSEAVAFIVADAVVANIVIDPEYAIMTATNTAVAYYKVFNQFGEDVTDGVLGATVNATGSDVLEQNRAGKKVVFKTTSTAGYTMNVSQVSLALVCQTNGVNVSKILTVSDYSKLNTVEFAGVYKYTAGVYVPATLTEGMDATDLANYYLLFKAQDQYGRTSSTTANFTLNLSSITGLDKNAPQDIFNYADYTSYTAYPLTSAKDLVSGSVTLLGVVMTSGKTVSGTIEIAPAKKVDTLSIVDMYGVYGGETNVLYYEALSADGEAITDFDTLQVLNTSLASSDAAFVRNADGTATLLYVADDNYSTISVPAVITCMTPTNKFTSVNLNVMPNPVATAVIGIDSTVALAGTVGADVKVGKTDFIFEDQYGNVLKDDSKAVTAAKIVITDVNASAAKNFVVTELTDTVDIECATKGSVSLKVALYQLNADGSIKTDASSNKVVKSGSDYTFNAYCVGINDVTDIAIADFDLLHEGEVIADELSGLEKNPVAPRVTGSYKGLKVVLQPDDYVIVAGPATAPAINTEKHGYNATLESFVTIVIKNNAGTELTKAYKYSNQPIGAAFAMVNPYGTFVLNNIVADTTVGTPVDAATLKTGAELWVFDQYNDFYPVAPRVTISGFDVNDAVVTGNGTDAAAISFKTDGYKVITIKYTWASGYSFELSATINVAE